MKIIASRDSVVASKCEWGRVCVWGGLRTAEPGRSLALRWESVSGP